MNKQDYELVVRSTEKITENDIAAVIIRIDEKGRYRVGAFGDIMGIDNIYSRICENYLLTLSQEALEEFIDSITLGLK